MDERWTELYMSRPTPLSRALISRELLSVLSHDTLVAIAWDVEAATKSPGSPRRFENTRSTTKIVDVLVRMGASDIKGID